MNYFVEGLQGSGKSTLVKRLSEKHPNYTAIHEGDYSPVELAWCAYVDRETYKQILEKYEIYNGNLDSETFRDIVLRRFKNWQGDNNIFECSIFQNIIEDMILFQKCSDEEIVDFYKQIKEVLADKPYEIVYLQADDIKSNIDIIRKERSDDQGNEMWFPLMLGYFDNSPYALEKGVKGTEALLEHFKHRQELELRICEELFPERNIMLRSKKYKI